MAERGSTIFYFIFFIGQIPCNSHEKDPCNTSRSMGSGGRSGASLGNFKQSDSAPENQGRAPGTRPALRSPQMSERAAELRAGSWRLL